jgi:hypothetical protein
MAKLFVSALVFGLSLQLVCYLFWAFDFFGGIISYPFGDAASAVSSVFSINAYSVLIGVGGSLAIGLAALLLRQGTYAIYAMLIWAIGCMFNIIQTFFLAIPNTIGALLPVETNPNPAVFPINPLIVVVGVIFVFAAWMYLFGLVIQRDTT